MCVVVFDKNGRRLKPNFVFDEKAKRTGKVRSDFEMMFEFDQDCD
jgi:hypothetical protein